MSPPAPFRTPRFPESSQHAAAKAVAPVQPCRIARVSLAGCAEAGDALIGVVQKRRDRDIKIERRRLRPGDVPSNVNSNRATDEPGDAMLQSHDDPTGFRASPAIERHARFLRLYTRHQHRILAYLFTLVPNRADAEDLLQETSVLLWEKFDQFEPETDFIAWACRVAYLKVLNHRKRVARSIALMTDALLESVADRAVELAPQLDRRREALRECLKRLDERDRRMITARYEPDGGVERAARVTGRSRQATYKALYRIRKALFDCVTLRVAKDSAR